MKPKDFLPKVRDYYTEKIETHGPSARGVDWNSRQSQFVRFDQLLRLLGAEESFSINDYGCGYGALVDRLRKSGRPFTYTGYDISEKMIERAVERHGGDADCNFVGSASYLPAADYTVASGVFNVRMEVPPDVWRDYCLQTIEKMARVSRKGFAFNILTSYSDEAFMKDYLYYADPCFFFAHCKRKYSRWVSLLHDYGLYEFTILVRNDTLVGARNFRKEEN